MLRVSACHNLQSSNQYIILQRASKLPMALQDTCSQNTQSSKRAGFKLAVTWPKRNGSLKNFTARKSMKFDTELIQRSPPFLKHVAALPWEIISPNLLCFNKGF